MPRILVFDVHGSYRAGLRRLIEAEIPCAEVVEASSPNHVLARIRQEVFELALLDTGRPSSGSSDFLNLAHQVSPATRIAIISASDTRSDILACLAAGFQSFISKHQSDTDIIAAIKDILLGRIYIPSSFADLGVNYVLDGNGAVSPTPPADATIRKLTKRQREVLVLLTRGRTNKEIARALDIAEATTKIHMTALLRALGVRNRTAAVSNAANFVNDAPTERAPVRSQPFDDTQHVVEPDRRHA